MTDPKANDMPEVIWAYRQDTGAKVWSLMHKAHHHRFIPYQKTMFYRAELVEELLKQIRDQIEFCKKHDHAPALDKTMMLIDKFLGDK